MLSAGEAKLTFGRSVANATTAVFEADEAKQFLALATSMKEIAKTWPEQLATLARTIESWQRLPQTGGVVDVDDADWLAFCAARDVALDATEQVSELYRSRTFERVVLLVEEQDPARAEQLRDLRSKVLEVARQVREELERPLPTIAGAIPERVIPAGVLRGVVPPDLDLDGELHELRKAWMGPER